MGVSNGHNHKYTIYSVVPNALRWRIEDFLVIRQSLFGSTMDPKAKFGGREMKTQSKTTNGHRGDLVQPSVTCRRLGKPEYTRLRGEIKHV